MSSELREEFFTSIIHFRRLECADEIYCCHKNKDLVRGQRSRKTGTMETEREA